MDYNINFPHLHIYLQHVPKSFSIGNFTIALYGVIIALGMVLAVVLASKIAKKTGQNPDTYFDLAIITIIAALIGARIYYVAFRWNYYKTDFKSVFNIREGGLAIYGGVIAAVLAIYIFGRVKKIKFGLMVDTAAPALILGQIIGRWGNFTNREAFGGYTDSLLAMQLPVSAVRASDCTEEILANQVVVDGISYIQVHPTFFYESALNLIVLALMLIFYKKHKFDGEVGLWYLTGYGIVRFFVEGLRTDSLMLPFGNLRVSQVLGIVLAIVGLIGVVVGRILTAKKAAAGPGSDVAEEIETSVGNDDEAKSEDGEKAEESSEDTKEEKSEEDK